MAIHELYMQAKTEYDLAQQAFNLAEGDYIDVATHRLKAALLNLNALTKEMKAGDTHN